MYYGRLAAFVLALVFLSGGIVGQDPAKKDKEDPAPKAKGQLPQNWAKIGLTDDQKQKVYTIQNKYNEEIDKLEAQIKTLKDKMSKERLEVLTADQKKKLKEITDAKTGG